MEFLISESITMDLRIIFETFGKLEFHFKFLGLLVLQIIFWILVFEILTNLKIFDS